MDVSRDASQIKDQAYSRLVDEINLMGMPLGAIKDFDYQLYETELNTGDCVIRLMNWRMLLSILWTVNRI